MSREVTTAKPIFIFGVPRSGTTLLRLLLTTHSEVSIPPESKFFVKLLPKYGNRQPFVTHDVQSFIHDLYADRKFTEWHVDRRHLTEMLQRRAPLSYAEAVAMVYQCYMAQRDATATHWGDKNPKHIYHLAKIFAVFPQARVVHVVRHVCGVYNSTKHPTFARGKSHNLLQIVSQKWERALAVAAQYQNHPGFFSIRYEDLLETPESVLRSLCQQLGLEYQPHMLTFYRKNQEEELVPRHRLGWHRLTLQPICPERAYAWEHELDREEIASLQAFHQERLQQLGYDMPFVLRRDTIAMPVNGFKAGAAATGHGGRVSYLPSSS